MKVTLGLILILLASLYQLRVVNWPAPFVQIPMMVGFSFAIFGAFFHLYHYGILKKGLKSCGVPDELITHGGFFNKIRHPMYLGDMIMGFGFMLVCLNGLTLGLWVALTVALCKQSSWEDHLMQESFSGKFTHWKENTHLIFPYIY